MNAASAKRPDQARRHGVVLFTAFEPSGDAHAAGVIRALLASSPGLSVYAWGGPRMEAAGATLLGRTADDGAMGLSALRRAAAVRGEIRRIRRWAREYRVLGHVAVDSPAANFPICKIMRRQGARIVHLVAPQLWAWGRWRLGKLRRLTDLVLCLLPFEEQWFNDRNIPARFVGHPVINRTIETSDLRSVARDYPQGSPRVAIFPGSRSAEVASNIRLLVASFTELQARHAGMGGLIVATSPASAAMIRRRVPVFPVGLHMTTGRPEAAIEWCDLALAVSGTVSLDLTRQRTPMVAVYRTGILSWLLSKMILRTRYRLLPNIIAEQEICPEFIPHVGGAGPIVAAASRLIQDSRNLAVQSEALSRVCQRFTNKRPDEESARYIRTLLERGTIE